MRKPVELDYDSLEFYQDDIKKIDDGRIKVLFNIPQIVWNRKKVNIKTIIENLDKRDNIEIQILPGHKFTNFNY